MAIRVGDELKEIRNIIHVMIREAYLAGTRDQGILMIKNRLENRTTFCEYDKVLMGPIDDKLGCEQGGQNSDKFFRLVGNSQLKSAQNSNLGVKISEDIHIAAIGQADDSCLMSTSIGSLQNLVNLTLEFCQKYYVELVPEKTKLLAFYPPSQSLNVYYSKLISDIHINGTKINFTEEAEHVGVIRNTSGNLNHMLNRFSAHTKAMNAVLPAGLARGHGGNPAAAIRVEKIYGLPVLLSGISSQVLNRSELEALNTHYKGCLEGLSKLYMRTPACVVYFLSSSLPTVAVLHMNMFSLFSMLIRLTDSPLARLAHHSLTSHPPPPKSWFTQLNSLCQQYGLPPALTLLISPPPKLQLKNLIKKKVTDFWESKLRDEAQNLSSLAFFKPEYHSLSSPHPIWSSAGSSPYETKKAVVQARMLSGRYRTEKLRRHWSINQGGYCLLPTCTQQCEDLQHILLLCPSLKEARDRVWAMWSNHLSDKPHISDCVHHYTKEQDDSHIQFLLDPSVLPHIISLTQEYGNSVLQTLFYLTRTFCYSVHRARLKLLGFI